MTGWLIGAITLILVVLILGRRSSRAFYRESEEPKYQFLENIGVPPTEPDSSCEELQNDPANRRQPDYE